MTDYFPHCCTKYLKEFKGGGIYSSSWFGEYSPSVIGNEGQREHEKHEVDSYLYPSESSLEL